LEAFKELDEDGDGFIPSDRLSHYLTAMGEVLNESELEYMLQLAEDPSSENPELIKIERIVQILIPSDNIMDEIKQKI